MSDPTLSQCVTDLGTYIQKCTWYDLVRARLNATLYLGDKLGITVKEVVTGTASPTSPAVGDLFLIIGHTGDYSSYNNSILEYLGTAESTNYREFTPKNSAQVYCLDDDYWYKYYTDRWVKKIDLVLYATVTGDGASGTVTDIMTIDIGDTIFPTLSIGEFWDVEISVTGTRIGGYFPVSTNMTGKWYLHAYVQQAASSNEQPLINNSTSAIDMTDVGLPYGVYESPTITIASYTSTGQLSILVGVTDPNDTVYEFSARITGLARLGSARNVTA